MKQANYSGLILAGGQGRRMGGQDKGLVSYRGRALVEYPLSALRPLCDDIVISANRNLDRYRQYGDKVVADSLPDFQGPLAGLAAALPACRHERVFVCPCDMPALDNAVFRQLAEAGAPDATVIARHNDIIQPVFLLSRHLHGALNEALQRGERRLVAGLLGLGARTVDIDAPVFDNINRLSDAAGSA